MPKGTKNKNDELLDLVDENDNVIGTIWKSEAHQNPKLIHREIAVAVFNTIGENLIQRRSLNKTYDPGMWQIASAGHVMAGENPESAAKREVFEELGINIKPIYFKKDFIKEVREARFFWIYYAIVKKTPEIQFDKSEVMDTLWVKPSELEYFTKKTGYNLDNKSKKMILKLTKYLKY